MTIDELIKLLSNQISALNNARTTALVLGEVDQVAQIDVKVIETQATLNSLKALAPA